MATAKKTKPRKKTTAKSNAATRRKATAKKAKAPSAPKAAPRDPRLPAVGSTLTRTYKGRDFKVKVLADGFEFEGETFRSLSGLARHIVGYQISGPVFFKLAEPKGK
ncbi:DUF2924 domain-containing protein [bacterium]|nr:DUF2924 domain-containing protein [bacterium]